MTARLFRTPQARAGAADRGRGDSSGRARLGFAARTRPRAVAHLRAARPARRRDRQGGLGVLAQGRRGGLPRRAGRSHRQARRRGQRVPGNRYYDGSPIYPGHFAQDWNRSYILEPDGPPVGAVVLLHGLTDSPYSLRHIARRYRDEGFVAVAIRMPAHGTVPAALTDVEWEDWDAATRLAVREARRRAGPSKPLHIVGFSNGGALAMKYALDALDNKQLARPDRLILISPMIGITSFARFAGIAALPALLPAFAKAAWLGILPEFNPFKYNSFPVNGARQSYRLTAALQDRIARAARDGILDRLPPVLTFQSVVDFTVSTRAIISAALCPPAGQRQRARPVRHQPGRHAGPSAAQRLRDRAVAHPGSAAAQVPDGDHHQRLRRHLQGRRKGDRGRRDKRADQPSSPWRSRPVSFRCRMSPCRFR